MNWDDLITAIHSDECILVLGPRAATYAGQTLEDLLIERLTDCLVKEHLMPPAECSADLPSLIKIFQSRFDATKALEETGKLLQRFYDDFADSDLPVYKLVAQLPFKHIINTAPNDLAKRAYESEGVYKAPLTNFFHFSKAIHNKTVNDWAVDLDKKIDRDRPLLYQLLGDVSQPDSLVLTDEDRLRFLDTVLQREKEATIPPNVAFYFIDPPQHLMRKTYLFVGFNFNEWHQRLFTHLLRRFHVHLPRLYTLQSLGHLTETKKFFYTRHFEMVFVEDSPEDFLEELQARLLQHKQEPKVAKNQVLLLYHEKDQKLRDELEPYLASLRRDGLAEFWDEGKILGGEVVDEVIKEHLATARLIVPLVTANFMASNQLYEQQLPAALERHESLEAIVAPILMEPYGLADTVFAPLNTLLPKPRGKALSQMADRAAALVSVVADLRRMLEKTKPTKPPEA